MKLSISVPDELWRRAEIVLGEQSPSAVVQAALSIAVGKVKADQEAELRPFAEACGQ